MSGFCFSFVLWVFLLLENFSLIWRRHHYKCRAANFDLYLALLAIENLGFFLTCHTYCDMGHLIIMIIPEEHDTHTLAVEQRRERCIHKSLSLPCFNDLDLSRLGFKHPTFYMQIDIKLHALMSQLY